jgi:hypothetical protein
MPTYKEIQLKVKQDAGFLPKTCWIAHVLSDHGKTRGPAHNRKSKSKRVCPCDDPTRYAAIKEALSALRMI